LLEFLAGHNGSPLTQNLWRDKCLRVSKGSKI
jgi:hypothetical protein